ncbi:MAG: DUF1501 domain-containing protein, partial [Pseudomonadota bacterium]
MTQFRLSRRAALLQAMALGLSVGVPRTAKAALESQATGLASEKRFIVLRLYGGLDGISALIPYGEPRLEALRKGDLPNLDQAHKVDGLFALHPALNTLKAMLDAGEAALIPAAATHDKSRSHFQAGNLLETGGPRPHALASGWLNRLAAHVPAHLPPIALQPQLPLMLRGQTEAVSLAPTRGVDMRRYAKTLEAQFRTDPMLESVWEEMQIVEQMKARTNPAQLRAAVGYSYSPARTRQAGLLIGKMLSDSFGPRIAYAGMGGFDTHNDHLGALNASLAGVDSFLAATKEGLRETWKDTLVLVVSEFGRTAHINGSRGTDHGTATTAILAGGAIKNAGIRGDWPGLGQQDLRDGRDLTALCDFRDIIAEVAFKHFIVAEANIATSIFPEKSFSI